MLFFDVQRSSLKRRLLARPNDDFSAIENTASRSSQAYGLGASAADAKSWSFLKRSTRQMWRTAILTICLLTSNISSLSVPPRVRRSSHCTQLNVLTRPREMASVLVHPVKPRTQCSKAQRKKVQQALNRQSMESVYQQVDEGLLNLFSPNYLYPTTIPVQPSARPKGRPAYVAGAMNSEMLERFRETQPNEALENASIWRSTSSRETKALPGGERLTETSPAVHLSKVKGKTTTEKTVNTLPTATNGKEEGRRRKPVVKSLPTTPSNRVKENGVSKKKLLQTHGNMDLQKYYATELLTADEEYSLGMKVQFMMKCEEVHEGLSSHLDRLPLMEEWAHACGFVQADKYFVATEADEELRPAGSDVLFDEMDPNLFVGNGQLGQAGPGRGRGRTRKAPCLRLKDFYDDSSVRHEQNSPTKRKLEPLNRGTPTDFVEMLMTAREAKQRMVQSNMRLVISIARKYANVGVGLSDLVQEGSLGLSRAAEKFEPKKGFKFSTYASWWIQQAVFRSIAYSSRTIRLPVHVHNLLNRVRRIRNELTRDLARYPTNEEMASKIGMSVNKYNKMLHLTKRCVSLEVPKYQRNPKDFSHPSEDLLGETISSSTHVRDDASPEHRVDRTLFHEDLREMLQILDEDERKVIAARYGLADGMTRTVTSVAVELKQSKAWVRSQECRALRKLRRPWYEKKLKEHQDALTN